MIGEDAITDPNGTNAYSDRDCNNEPVRTVDVNKYSVIWHHFSHTKHPNTY